MDSYGIRLALVKINEFLKRLSDSMHRQGGARKMTEDPMKLFPRLADQYPQRDTADTLYGLTRAGLQFIPGAGGAVAELFSMVLAPSFVRRQEDWFKKLAGRLERVEAKVESFKLADLAKNEAFISATIQATRIAVGTHQEEKRRLLQNALLNVAVGERPNEELQQVFFNAIEAFTPSHVRVLEVLWKGENELIQRGRKPYQLGNLGNYGNVIRILIPELQGHDDLVQCIMTDLRSRGFSTASGPDAAFPSGKLIANVGIEFLWFIRDPDVEK